MTSQKPAIHNLGFLSERNVSRFTYPSFRNSTSSTHTMNCTLNTGLNNAALIGLVERLSNIRHPAVEKNRSGKKEGRRMVLLPYAARRLLIQFDPFVNC